MPKELIKENTTFELGPDDTGVIMTAGGEIQIVLPKINDNKNLPTHVQFMAAIIMLMETDKNFVDEVLNKFYKLLEDNTGWKPNEDIPV